MARSQPCNSAEQTCAAHVKEARQSQEPEVQSVGHAEALDSKQSDKAHL
jgi:hypothetical protein